MVDLGGGLDELGDEEQRVVAEAAVAAGGFEDLAVPFAAGNDGLWVVGMADEDQRAVEAGAAVGLAGQAFEEQGVVAGVGLGFAGEARRQHARRAAEGVDAQPGVVGEGRQAGGAGGVAGLGDGVLDEAGVGLLGLAHVEGRLGQHLDAQRGEERG